MREACSACSFVRYENPLPLVAVVLCCEDKILWIKRAHDPHKGQWALPAGFVEMGESLQEAAVREFIEETGIALNPEALAPLTILSLPHIGQIYVSFRYHSDRQIPATITDEILDWGWLSESEVPWEDMAHVDLMQQAHLIYECLRSGSFPMTVGTLTPDRARYQQYAPSI